MIPKAAVPQASSARKECAALPAKSALARVAPEPACDARGRANALQAEPPHEDGMPRKPERGRQHVPGELSPGCDERRVQPPPVRPAVAQTSRRDLDRSLEHGRGSIIERMRERRRRLHPIEAVRAQRQAAEEGRGDGEGVDGGADIVHEARQRELR